MSKNGIPEGFKMTELGALPEEWEVVRIGDVFEVKQGKQLSSKEKADGKVRKPFLRTSNLLWGKVDITKVDEMPFTKEEFNKLKLQENDIIVCEGGAIGRTALYRGEVKECAYQNHIHRLRSKDRNVENLFFVLWMEHAIKQKRMYIHQGNVTTIPNLSQSRLKNFKIPLPPLPEQHRIAAVLSAVQDAKEKTGAVIAAAKSLKKSLMRHLFTYGPVSAGAAESAVLVETEIGLVPEGWEVTQLGVICNLFQYGTSKRCHLDEVGIPVLRIPNVVNGRIDTQELKYINLEDKKAEKLRLSSGDLLFVRTNGQRKYVGRCSIYKEELRDALFASYLIRAKLNADVALPEYIQFYTTTQKGQEYLSGRASGAADGKFNINQQILKSVLVPLPPLPTQQKIASTLSTVDKKIEAEENKKKAIDELFRSLLHNLMTGKIRVNHLEAIS